MKKWLFVIFAFVFWTACSDDDETAIDVGGEEKVEFDIENLDSIYVVQYGEKLVLSPVVASEATLSYLWKLDDKKVAETLSYTFEGLQNGVYQLLFQVSHGDSIKEKDIKVIVTDEQFTYTIGCNEILHIDIPSYEEFADRTEWKMLNAASELHRLTVVDGKPLFAAAASGKYQMEAVAGDVVLHVEITVNKASKRQTPYFAKVFDYSPAPGQFVNDLPKYDKGDTQEDMNQKVADWIVGDDTYMITLGGWGGSVTLGFDHTIVNVAGKRDFRVLGNAFGSEMGRPNAPFGGSCEPGIIMVAYDKNKNGRPDEDEWYEINGSGNFSAEKELWYPFAKENGIDLNVYRDYEMTYYRPVKEEADGEGEIDNPTDYILVKDYIRWENNKGGSGYKEKNVYHHQSYYPAWIDQDKLTFKGIRLAQNALNEGAFVPGINEGNIYYVLYAYRYGYVDNQLNTSADSAIDIDWAIDKDGKKVVLPGIDFIKIYNGVDQNSGWLGECSTEVDRGEDLHMLGQSIDTIKE